MSVSSSNMPQREPVLRIGIILPIDKLKKVTISFTDSALYEIETEKQLNPSSETPDRLDVSVNDVDMIIRKTVDVFDEHGITIHDVPAGRGFHWEKTIDVTAPGNVYITNQKDYLQVTNEVPLEQYLACVAVSEMSARCPSAFLEAQIMAARSWLLANRGKNHPDLQIDVCNDDCCQRYQGINNFSEDARQSTEACRGQVLTIKGDICDARYSKSCGGITEAGANVWPQKDLDYLVSIEDGEPAFCGPGFISEADLPEYLGSVDEHRSYFRWDFEILQEELTDHMNKIHSLNGKAVLGIENEKRGPSGRIISCDLVYLDSNNQQQSKHLESEYTIRQTLSPSFLFSSAFKMNLKNVQKGIPGSFSFEGKGWGHGAGMCQIGALGMALNGSTAESILTHYFPKAKLTRIYSS